MHPRSWFAALVAAAVLGIGIVLALPAGHVLGSTPVVDAYTVQGTPMRMVLVSVPFESKTHDDVRLQAAVDWNGDAEISDEEWSVRNVMPMTLDGGLNRFAVSIPEGTTVGEELPVFIALTDSAVETWSTDARESVTAAAPVRTHDLLGLWDIAAPGASQDLKRGIFAEVAHAQDVDVQRTGDVGDLSGGPMDCFPIAATNNIISLAEEHGQRGALPANPADMINELKTDMQFNNGVLTQNFVPGKQAFLARHGLPIVTQVIAKPTFQQIADALAEGGAVELSMANVRSAAGHPDTGHVVTVVGAAAADGQSGIFAHDPATPEGADFLGVRPPPGSNTFWRLEYPLWDGVTVIDYLYVQKWVDGGDTGGTTGVSLPEEDEQPRTALQSVETLAIGGKNYPRFQFRVGGHEACDADHYHSNARFVYATDLTRIEDPAIQSCGFGTVAEVPVETVTMTPGEHAAMMEAIAGR